MTNPQKQQIILGIDPGTRITGYGIIKVAYPRIEPIDFGCIRPPASLSSSDRYLAIFNGIDHLLELYAPDAVAVETQFVKKNIQSAMKLGMARAVAILAASRRKIPVYEYAPTKAKLAVVGHGNASKEQVQRMVQCLLSLSQVPEPEDAADALAIAICHSHGTKHV